MNNSYNPIDVIKGFIVSVWLGASRFAYIDMVRYDQVLPKIFGWMRFPSSVTFTRYFLKFDEKKNNEVFPALARSFFEKARLPSRITLDVDSTVITRFGEQEGAAVGYTPGPEGPGLPPPAAHLHLRDEDGGERLAETGEYLTSWQPE